MMKRYFIKGFLVLLAMHGLFTACSKDDADLDKDGSGKPIMLSAAGIASDFGRLTRTIYADTYNTELPSGKKIDVFIYASDNTDISIKQSATGETSHPWVYQTVGAANAGKSSLSLVPADMADYSLVPKYPTDNNSLPYSSIKLFAVYPHLSGASASGSYNFTVNSNQTGKDSEDNDDPESILSGDLMATTLTTYTEEQCENAIDLTMSHQMAKIHVSFVPSGDLTAANMPTSFKVLNVYRTISITPLTGTISLVNTDPTTSTDPLIASTQQAFFIPPQTFTPAATPTEKPLLTFDILPSGNFKGITGCAFYPSSEVQFQANTRYELVVTVDVDHVTVTATIIPWDKNNLTDTDFQETTKIVL